GVGGTVVFVGVGVGPVPSEPPSMARANFCGPLGILNALTVTVYVPAAGAWIYTFSTLLRRSAVPPVALQPPAKTFPRKVPLGPLTVRSRSLTRFTEAVSVDAKSDQTKLTLSGPPVLVTLKTCEPPVLNPVPSSTNAIIPSVAPSRLTRPQPS